MYGTLQRVRSTDFGGQAASQRAQGAVPKTKLFINGQFVDSTSATWLNVHNPVRPLVFSMPLWREV